MPKPLRIPAYPLAAAFLAAALMGCASSTMPLHPLPKGESRHGISVQTQYGSFLNYHYSRGLTDYLDLGLQAGYPNAGAKARLHFPLGPKTRWSLTNGLLAFWDDGAPDAYNQHTHLRWEGRLALIRTGAWFDYALGPIMSVETLVPGIDPEDSDAWVQRNGFSLAFGGSRFGVEADWSINVNSKSELAESYSYPGDPNPPDYGGTDQEWAIKLLWSWGGKARPARSAPARGPAHPAPVQDAPPGPPAASLGTLPVTDPLVEFGAAHCGAGRDDFSLWLSRHPDGLNLAQDALDAGRSRFRSAGLSAGGGVLLFLLGGGVFAAGALDAEWGTNEDRTAPDTTPRPRLRHASPVNGGTVLGGLLMAGGTGLILRGLYLTFFDSPAERALTRAWKYGVFPPPPRPLPAAPKRPETPPPQGRERSSR